MMGMIGMVQACCVLQLNASGLLMTQLQKKCLTRHPYYDISCRFNMIIQKSTLKHARFSACTGSMASKVLANGALCVKRSIHGT